MFTIFFLMAASGWQAAYQQEQNTAGRSRHEFTLPAGDHIRCVDIESHAAPPLTPLGSREIPDNGAEEHVRRLFGMDGSSDGEGHARRCPANTIPKRIPSLETLLQFRTRDAWFEKHPQGGGFEMPRTMPPAQALSSAVHEWAAAAVSVENRGGRATFNTWNPFVEQPGEFSVSQLWLSGGSGPGLQTVEAGWQVYRNLYGDNRTRLFIYSTSGGYAGGTGCYNLDCGRFVQTSSAVILGAPLDCTSVDGGRQCEIDLEYVRADSSTRDWWLRVNGVWIGYYPGSLFNGAGIGVSATELAVGGEIVNLSAQGIHTMTGMGSGHPPSEGYGHAAYIRAIQYVDAGNMYKDVTAMSTTQAMGNYQIAAGTGTVFFGGPGRPLSTTTLRSASTSSTTLSAPSTLTIAFTIDATLPDNVLLGAAIQPAGSSTSSIPLPTNERKVTLAAGSNVAARSFSVPGDATPGSYDLQAALWRDLNGNGVIDNADQFLGTMTYPSALTVAAPARKRASR